MNYQLHDYMLGDISLERNQIIFSFPDGFYTADETGKRIEPLRKKLVFTIANDDWPLETFISVRIKKTESVWKVVPLQKLLSILQEENLIVYDEYDSKSTSQKMFKLNSSKCCIEIFIDEIIRIDCLCE